MEAGGYLMFKFKAWRRLAAVSAVVLSLTPVASHGADATKVPQFKLDTSWPKLPLPDNWALASIGGIFLDAKDHVWIYHSPRILTQNILGASATPKRGNCCVAGPFVIEIDKAGNVVQSWGGPGEGYDWPSFEHGIYIDYKDNVWIGGSQTRVGRDGQPEDGMVLKFTRSGKFLMQIGGRGPSKGNLDPTQLSGPANFAVDAEANEVFIADGYGNHRVIVFDADSGKFKRLWGAYGKPPTDEKLPAYDPSAPPSPQFRLVHGIRIAKDGLVYVTDRLNDRVQVFKKDGTFVSEFIYDKDTRGAGSVGNVTFWPDAKQSLMAINDPGNFQIRLARRSDGATVGAFGHFGTYAGQLHLNHQVEFDSEGNLYTSEDSRVQKFVPSFRPGK
jgi:DNA-binding beta-propeller fold protein YncE